MTEPTVSGACIAAPTSVACLGILGSIGAIGEGVLFGAFAGSVVFVLSKNEIPIWQRWLYLVVSMIGGVLAAGFAADVLQAVVPGITVPKGVGALLASALVVKVLTLAIRAETLSSILPGRPKP